MTHTISSVEAVAAAPLGDPGDGGGKAHIGEGAAPAVTAEVTA